MSNEDILKIAEKHGGHCLSCSSWRSPSSGRVDVELCEQSIIQFAREIEALAKIEEHSEKASD